MAKLIMFRTVLPRAFIAFCLLGLVTARNPAVSPSTSIAPGTSSLLAQNSRPPLPNIGRTRAFDLAGMFHIEFNPITCSPEGHTNAVVLASNQLEYDTGEIQQTNTYLGQIYDRGVDQSRGTPHYDDPPAPPAMLTRTSGTWISGSTGSHNDSCSGNLQVTNIGKSAIQITGVNMRLLSNAQLNRYHYRLIDLCSINLRVCQPPFGLFISNTYSFNLSMAKANTVFFGQFQGNQPFFGNQPLLDPGQVALLRLYFYSSKNLIYSVAPEITVSLVNQQTTYTLSQLTSTLAFANPGQFSCYQLQSNGNTFTQINLNTQGALCS